MQCRAFFLSKEKCEQESVAAARGLLKTTNVQPFVNEELNESVMEWRNISPEVTVARHPHHPEATEMFSSKGFAAVNLQEWFNGEHFNDARSNDNDDRIRLVVERFWKSKDGMSLLKARFPENDNALSVIATHVTHRKVPPDGMSLVHIDYSSDHDLLTLTSEWWSRWKSIFSEHELIGGRIDRCLGNGKDQHELQPETVSDTFDLVGVVTVWICLQPNEQAISNYPLLIADASTVGKDDLYIYKVGKRHSVGVTFCNSTRWYHVPNMVKGDAWIFDTMNCPHVSVDLNREEDPNFERISAEVRCLILRKKRHMQIRADK